MMRYINLFFFAGMIFMNYLANSLPLNGKTTGELSDAYPNLFVPAGVTFSIWGIIYILLLVFCVYQFFPASKEVLANIGWLFALSCIFNAMWIVAWHYQKVPLSLVIMVGLLISLIYINTFISSSGSGLVKAAFGIYLGWICIATIANVTALLVSLNWNGFGFPQQVWTIIMISAGTIIIILAIMDLNNPFIGLAVIWAFLGIVIKRIDDHLSIVIAASACAVIVAIITILALINRLRV